MPLGPRLKRALLQTRLGRTRLLISRWAYQFTPAQLAFLIRCLDNTVHLPGPVVEVGCFRGATTIWLNKHLEAEGIEKRYVAIDTFSGFLDQDVQTELTSRAMSSAAAIFKNGFAVNSKQLFDATISAAGFTNVESYEADAAAFDFSRLGDISFALLDVDLYAPTGAVLPLLYAQMAKGGIIVVDDCQPNNAFDGANQAYLEFLSDRGLSACIEYGKLGVIEV